MSFYFYHSIYLVKIWNQNYKQNQQKSQFFRVKNQQTLKSILKTKRQRNIEIYP